MFNLVLMLASILLFFCVPLEQTAMVTDSPWNVLTWVTSTLTHADIYHLSGNMLFSVVFGITLEQKVGWEKLFNLWIAEIVIGNIVVLFLAHWMGNTITSLGLSGFLFAELAYALIVFGNESKKLIALKTLGGFFILGTQIVLFFIDRNLGALAHFVGALVGATFGFMPAFTKADVEDKGNAKRLVVSFE